MAKILLVAAAILVTAPFSPANAAQGEGCSKIAQEIKTLATTIGEAAAAYWARRERFVDLRYGSRVALPNAKQFAEDEQASAEQSKSLLPQSLARFRNLVAEARDHNCVPAEELSAIAEPAIKRAKAVIFDQFPPDESSVGIAEPKSPGMQP